MACRKKPSPEEIVAKLRQVEVSAGQVMRVADAFRSIGATRVNFRASHSDQRSPPSVRSIIRAEVEKSFGIAPGVNLVFPRAEAFAVEVATPGGRTLPMGPATVKMCVLAISRVGGNPDGVNRVREELLTLPRPSPSLIPARAIAGVMILGVNS
jgi:hypothetical protein